MTDSSKYRLPFRRRREQKTDYDQRLKLLKSGRPRAVIRTSNKNTRVHIAYYEREGDENKAQTISKELEEYGWEHNTGNLPAAYLTGYLSGKKAETDEAILDLGLRDKKEGGRVYAALKGLIDSGVEVPAGEEIFPAEGRVKGEHIKEMKDIDVPSDVEKVKENIEGDY